MSYSRNFGMRSFENIVRDGRFRAPVAAPGEDPLLIGSPVVVDGDNPGFMRPADAGEAPSQIAGIAVFEHIQFQGVDTNLVSNHDAPFNQVPPGRYAQMVHGQGAKVWFKNTGNKPLYDGRIQENLDLLDDAVDFAALRAGDGLVPNGTGGWRVAAAGDPAATPPTEDEVPWLTVEQVNPSTKLVEVRINF